MLCVRAATSGRFYCAAVVTASIAVGMASQASAATYYWSDSEPGIVSPDRTAPPRRPKPRHNQDKVTKATEKEPAKPQGPLILAVSVNKQQVKVYDANGLFTQAPVSTGMKDHATPMGVFSVIQKQKYHRSNIYSGAPMPFMQRVTWSGIALHAGVLPGYPASHGCVRMPPGFAVKMYGLTRMGARVIITPGEVAPSSFTHPLLAAFKAPAPTASAQPEPNAPAATKSDKGAALDLRSTIGHDGAKATVDVSTASLREQTHTADAGSAGSGQLTASDVPSGATAASKRETTPESAATMAVPNKPGTPVAPEATGSSRPADASVARSQALLTKSEDSATPAAASTADKPVDADEQNKDQTRLLDADNPAAPGKPELKRNSQVAIFISRKDGKLYVRQSLSPVFSMPVTITASDRPLGTHVFTAAVDKADASIMHWSVISMPSGGAAHSNDGEKASRRGKKGGDIEAKVVPAADSATEALDRITVPADVAEWLGGALSSGSSLIVSDQGINQGETGEGTEFILSLR
jgi:lipoprotein-anchoring transpeptidase ErfK/SrfK